MHIAIYINPDDPYGGFRRVTVVLPLSDLALDDQKRILDGSLKAKDQVHFFSPLALGYSSGKVLFVTNDAQSAILDQVTEESRPQFDADFSPENPQNVRVARARGLSFDPNKNHYVDEEGSLVCDKFGQPL